MEISANFNSNNVSLSLYVTQVSAGKMAVKAAFAWHLHQSESQY